MRLMLFMLCLLLSLSGCSSIIYESGLKKRDHAMERRIVKLINEARAKARKCGSKYYKPANLLVWDDMLGQAALKHSMDMAQNGFLSHKGSDNSSPGDRITKTGYRWLIYGEDVGQGYRTPEEAVDGWLKSEIHCKNIMNPEFREAGSAYAKSSSLRIYWTIVFGTQRQ